MREDPIRLVVASANPDKVAEIAEILEPLGFSLVSRPASVPDVVEDAPDLVGNARLKAIAICEATGEPAVADDTGLEVDALGGAPGVHSARYAGEEGDSEANVAKLLVELGRADARTPEQRTARFRTVALVRFPDGREMIADGVVEGTIVDEPRGAGGFGYDPVFAPMTGPEAETGTRAGAGRTFAEMSPAEKHAISHRGRAFRALALRFGASRSR